MSRVHSSKMGALIKNRRQPFYYTSHQLSNVWSMSLWRFFFLEKTRNYYQPIYTHQQCLEATGNVMLQFFGNFSPLRLILRVTDITLERGTLDASNLGSAVPQSFVELEIHADLCLPIINQQCLGANGRVQSTRMGRNDPKLTFSD